MTIDINKIKAGDKVQLEVDVTERNGVLRFSISAKDERALDPNHPWWRNEAKYSIVGHTPAPWVPAAGDRIRVINTPAAVSTILYVDKDGDWLIEHDSGGKIFSPKIYHKYYELI